MGFRGSIKKGGGFLNNVDGTVKSYEFSRRFKGDKKDGERLFFVPSIKLDGAEDEIDQHIFIGLGERYEVSDDGQELTMANGDPVSYGYSMPFGLFMDSLIGPVDAPQFPEDKLPDTEGGEPLELSAIVDERFRFKQVVDEAGNAKVGKRVVGTGKNKKEYDRTNTVIDQYLGGTSASRTNGSGKSAGGKKGKKDEDEGDPIETRAVEVLKEVLADEPLNRKKLSLPVTSALLTEKDKKFAAAVKAMVLDEDFQAAQVKAGWLEIDKKENLSA